MIYGRFGPLFEILFPIEDKPWTCGQKEKDD